MRYFEVKWGRTSAHIHRHRLKAHHDFGLVASCAGRIYPGPSENEPMWRRDDAEGGEKQNYDRYWNVEAQEGSLGGPSEVWAKRSLVMMSL